MKRLSVFVFLSLLMGFNSVWAQDYYNQSPEFLRANSFWAFGFNAGLDFNQHVNGNPLSVETSTYLSWGGAATSSPVTGELLFYAGPQTLFNKNGDTMLNGKDLVPNNSRTSQGELIVPVIDTPGKYYVFLLDYAYDYDKQSVLTYSVVDMSLDNGLGAVEPGRKNLYLDTSRQYSQTMIAIPGNNCDVWLMLHTTIYPKENPETTTGFLAYHITREGINPNPVYSPTVEMPKPPNSTYGFTAGTMAVSPNREMIAITSHASPTSTINTGVILAQFDAETGIVSNGIWVAKGTSYGVCFSPDNTKLYTTTPTWGTKHINQYTISNYDSAAIANSHYQVSTVATRYQAMKLYNDTIYVAYTNTGTLDRINNPNEAGAACGYEPAAITLIKDRSCQSGLPSEVVYIGKDTTHNLFLDTLVCTSTGNFEVEVGALPGYNGYEWNDGGTEELRSFNEPGTYWVLAKDDCHSRIDTFIIRGGDVNAMIRVDSFDLSTTEEYDSYQWYLDGEPIEGANQRVYTVLENGNYTVAVFKGLCSDTSDIYRVTNVPTSIKDNLDLSSQILIYPNPASDIVHIQSPIPVSLSLTTIEGRIIMQEENVKDISLRHLAPGVYLLHIMDREGRIIKMEKIVKDTRDR